MANLITDESFDGCADVGSIRYRLHPLDVGFDVREEGLAVAIGDERMLRVSYPDRHGERRVLCGPRDAVLRRLRGMGFRFLTRIAAPKGGA